jgi:hypothetical protein
MNYQDHLYRHADPRQVSRRWFLEQCGVGLGSDAKGRGLESKPQDLDRTAVARLLLTLDETFAKE